MLCHMGDCSKFVGTVFCVCVYRRGKKAPKYNYNNTGMRICFINKQKIDFYIRQKGVLVASLNV